MASKGKSGLDKDRSPIDRQIDENLRRVYQQTVEEQVPERFTELLKRLKEQETRQ